MIIQTKTTLDTLYLINDSKRIVSIEIVVGDEGQTSSLSVSLDNKDIVSNHIGNLPKTGIEENNHLQGKKLKIQATVTDTSKETNVTSLNIKISGGFLIRNYHLYKMIENEGESADYYCNIEFFNPSNF
jgi:hypothetical protein